MILSVEHSILIISICAVCTFAERLFPFIIFGKNKVPEVVVYLGKILPMAVMATLVMYCLRNIGFETLSGFAPQMIAVIVTALLHYKKGNTLLSVAGGTACYMVLVQFVF